MSMQESRRSRLGFFLYLCPYILAMNLLFHEDEQTPPFTFPFPQFPDCPFLGGVQVVGDMSAFIFDDQKSFILKFGYEVRIKLVGCCR